MAAISFRGSPPAAPTRRPGDIANSPVDGCAPGGPRSNPDARSDARPSDVLSIRDAVARISASVGSVRGETLLGLLAGFFAAPGDDESKMGSRPRERRSSLARWRSAAARAASDRGDLFLDALARFPPFPSPLLGFLSAARVAFTVDRVSARGVGGGSSPTRTTTSLELSHPLRPPPAAATVARRIHSRSARRRAASSCRACMRSRNACPRSSRRRRLSSASRDDRDSPRGRRAGRIPASLNDAAR